MIEYDRNASGLILSIGHGTKRDGPGWRSIVYFMGCNFRCRWCSSPQTFEQHPVLMTFGNLEKYPHRAAACCKRGAVSVSGRKSNTDRSLCSDCTSMECAAFCIDGSREVAGYTTTVEDVLSEVGEFKKFSRNYGATLSGGEPTLQWNFYIELLKGFKSCGCNTAVETNGSSVNLVESAEWVDLFIIDIKHIDDAKHVELTGCSNANVLSNVRELAKRSHTVWVRIPLIPGINDGENLSETARFLKSINNGNLSVEILGYHRLGEYKWEAVGKEYPMKDTAQPSERDVANARGVFRDQGINVIVT